MFTLTAPRVIGVRLAPKSEPPTDDELEALGIDLAADFSTAAAPLLPLDLPTGVRVQRAPRTRRPAPQRPAPPAPPKPVPQVQRATSIVAPRPERHPPAIRPKPQPKQPPAQLRPAIPGHPAVRLAIRNFLATCVEVV